MRCLRSLHPLPLCSQTLPPDWFGKIIEEQWHAFCIKLDDRLSMWMIYVFMKIPFCHRAHPCIILFWLKHDLLRAVEFVKNFGITWVSWDRGGDQVDMCQAQARVSPCQHRGLICRNVWNVHFIVSLSTWHHSPLSFIHWITCSLLSPSFSITK